MGGVGLDGNEDSGVVAGVEDGTVCSKMPEEMITASSFMNAVTPAEFSSRVLIICAATPAAWGHAMDVPLIVAVAMSLDIQVDVIDLPGAKMSTQDPKLLYEDRPSSMSVEPTVMAVVALAGE